MQQKTLQTRVRHILRGDASVWEELRKDHWPHGAADHAAEIESFFAGTINEPVAVLVAEERAGEIVAFVELSIRVDVPGLEGTRVGYVEGLYIRPTARQLGIARRLLQASRNWAHQQECAAFASDRAGRIIIYKGF